MSLRAKSGLYELDPVRDLVPICGNCHAIVHRRLPDVQLPEQFRGSLGAAQAERLANLHEQSRPDDWETTEE